MSYVENQPFPLAFGLAKLAAAVVVLLGVFFVPLSLVVTMGFWGASLAEVAFRIVAVSVIPISAISLAFTKARSLEEAGRDRLAAAIRFAPLALQLLIAPVLIGLVGKIWSAMS